MPRALPIPAMGLLLTVLAAAQPAGDVTVCDLDEAQAQWRSKFGAHEIVEAQRDGQKTHALLLRYDLSKSPHYDWVRVVLQEGLDVRALKYLSFRVKADGSGARVTPMLMQLVEKNDQAPHGEIVASAGNYPRFDLRWLAPGVGAAGGLRRSVAHFRAGTGGQLWANAGRWHGAPGGAVARRCGLRHTA